MVGYRRSWGFLCGALLVGQLTGAAGADPLREPVDLIPAQSMLCWYGRPLPGMPAGDAGGESPSTLQTLLELGARIVGSGGGALPKEAQLNVRMAEMFALVVRYPHAFALIDTAARPTETDPTARRVDRLQFAVAVRLGETAAEAQDAVEPFLRVIQKAVNEQTNQGAATLAQKCAGDWSYQELRDQRLPDWAVIAWGLIDEHFILTVGAGVWPAIAAVAGAEEPALTHAPWYIVARGKTRNTALIEIFVAVKAIQERLDPFVDGRASALFGTWSSEPIQQAYWAIGFEERAMYCRAALRQPDDEQGSRTMHRLYADPQPRAPHLLATIPDNAKFAVFQVAAGRLLPRFFGSLLAMQGPAARSNIERIWREIQQTHDFDVERDLLANLGRHIVMHNDPPHPLHLPLAITTLIEIERNPADVRRTLERFCAAWQATLDDVAQRAALAPAEKNPPPFTLHRDPDGVWYVRFNLAGPRWLGLAGPAWTVTDRFIIVSWSPLALREYLDRVGDAAGRRSP